MLLIIIMMWHPPFLAMVQCKFHPWTHTIFRYRWLLNSSQATKGLNYEVVRAHLRVSLIVGVDENEFGEEYSEWMKSDQDV